MKVRELIEDLLKLDQEARIFFDDTEGGLEDPGVVEIDLYAVYRPYGIYLTHGEPGKYNRDRYLVSGPTKAYAIELRYKENEKVLPGEASARVDDVRVREDPAPGRKSLPGLG